MAGAAFSISITGVDALAQRYGDQVRAGAAVGIEQSILLLENAVKTKIQEGRDVRHFGPAVATGTLLGAVFSEMRGTPASPQGIVAVSPPADRYALVVEKGRRPGQRQPPSDVLIPWIRQKLRDGFQAVATIKGRKQKAGGRRQATERGLAFVVARSIGRKGFPGVHMFRNAFGEQKDNVIRIIREAVRAAVGRGRGQ